MNCKQCQEKIIDSLAGGAGGLAPDIAAHQHSCMACHEFYEAQAQLFASMGAELHSVVNRPVPPSFLPSLHMRLGDKPVAERSWIPRRRAALFAAVVILAFSLGYVLRRPVPQPDSQQRASLVARSTGRPQAAAPDTHLHSPEVTSTTAPTHVSAPPLRKACFRGNCTIRSGSDRPP